MLYATKIRSNNYIKTWIYSTLLIVLVNTANAQSNFKQIDKLALKCKKGHAKSCEKIKFIALNDNNSIVKACAVKNIHDQSFLINLIKSENNHDIQLVAIKNITNQDLLFNIAKKDNNSDIICAAVTNINNQNYLYDIIKSVKNKQAKLIATSNLDGYESKEEILELIDNYKGLNEKNYNYNLYSNIAAIGTLKLLPYEKWLMKYYDDIKISINFEKVIKMYYGGRYERLNINITINTNNISKTFRFEGKEGGEIESSLNMGVLHLAIIDVNIICEHLLNNVIKPDLAEISNKSQLYYLRESATKMLSNKE